VASVTVMTDHEHTARPVQIGALASATGLTVRTLHHQLASQRRLKRTLTRILELLELGSEPTPDLLIQAIEETAMVERYYTPEQQEQLAQRRQELGEEGLRRAERDWAELIDAVKAEQSAGTAPTDPRMLQLAREWRGLVEQFTGGDEGIRRSLETMYFERGADAASRGTVDEKLMRYVGQAIAALERRSS
jgi:MerR family transcriptional regulator, thiopeptide resistance regulator